MKLRRFPRHRWEDPVTQQHRGHHTCKKGEGGFRLQVRQIVCLDTLAAPHVNSLLVNLFVTYYLAREDFDLQNRAAAAWTTTPESADGL